MRISLARSAGFTLIELVLAVGITGILIALVVSAYRTHSVRMQVAAGIETAAHWEPSVEHSFRASGQVPANTPEIGPTPNGGSLGTYVVAIDVVDGRLDITYGKDASPAILGRRLSLTPYETASREILWLCGNAVPGLGLKPLGFADGGRQSVQASATVEARYLPSKCR
jgi:type IV pilus assembly protein PilA